MIEKKYYYLLGISVKGDMFNEQKTYLKYFMKWTSDDVNDFELASWLKKNKIISLTEKEIVKICGLENIIVLLNSFRISCQINMCTIHLFHTDEPWEEEIFENMVKNYKIFLDKFRESQIHL